MQHSKKNSIIIEGNQSSSQAAQKFAEFFKQTTSPNSTDFDRNKRAEYSERIQNYTGDALAHQCNFSAEVIAIAPMKGER
jgi:hypothetical protein